MANLDEELKIAGFIQFDNVNIIHITIFESILIAVGENNIIGASFLELN